jgi:signal transduction histidine kinase
MAEQMEVSVPIKENFWDFQEDYLQHLNEPTFVDTQATDIDKKINQLIALYENGGLDEELIYLIANIRDAEKNKEEDPEMLQSRLSALDIKIQERLYFHEGKNFSLQELTPDELKRQDSFFRTIVQDFLGKELLHQIKRLKNIIQRDPLDMEFLLKLEIKEDENVRMLFDSVFKLLKEQEKDIYQLKNVNTDMMKKFSYHQRKHIEFLEIFGHDYIGLLGNVVNLVNYLEESNPEETLDEDYWKSIIKSNPNQLSELVKERMLLLQESDYKDHQLSNVFAKSIQQLNGRLAKKQIQLELKGGDINVFSDSARMHVWLYNFLTNATKFTQEGGIIFVSAENIENKYVKVSVQDNGGGISPAKLEEIQKMFENEIDHKKITSEKGTNGESGTGKGLRNCADLAIRVVGAKLEVSSEEGEGTTFSFIVPATEEQHNVILQEEEKRVEKIAQEVPLLVQGILSNTKKREPEREGVGVKMDIVHKDDTPALYGEMKEVV